MTAIPPAASLDDIDAVLALVRATQTDDRASFLGVLANLGDGADTLLAAVMIINQIATSLAISVGADFDVNNVLTGARIALQTEHFTHSEG